LVLPKPRSNPDHAGFVESHGPIVIVGANGSGKTRLGVWLDLHSENKTVTHRIAAQKSLHMPLFSSPTTLDFAHKTLLFGYQEGTVDHKVGHRWKGEPELLLLSDFDKLMVYLFTEEWETCTQYRQASLGSREKVPPSETKLDVLKRIWERTLPHRELIIRGGKVETKSRDSNAKPYSSTKMSDGERVIFYLIGQALSAPENGVLLIDEPEMHLHKAVQARLWDSIENQRPDCLFVYLTHDLDFAATRVGSKKICLKDYDGGTWDWFEVPAESDLPEQIMLEIVGSRRPVLFVEGEKTSLDYFLFQHVFPDFTIIPRGGCEQVIQTTATYNALESLHRLRAFGIVDRDVRNEMEVGYLKDRNVFVIDVSAVENLLLHEDVLRAIATKLHIPDATSIVESVRQYVLSELETQKERVVSRMVTAEIEKRLKAFDAKAVGPMQIKASVESYQKSVDVDQLFLKKAGEIEQILAASDYASALRIFTQKGLLAHVASAFGFKRDEFLRYFKRLAASNDGLELIEVIQKHLPAIPAA